MSIYEYSIDSSTAFPRAFHFESTTIPAPTDRNQIRVIRCEMLRRESARSTANSIHRVYTVV